MRISMKRQEKKLHAHYKQGHIVGMLMTSDMAMWSLLRPLLEVGTRGGKRQRLGVAGGEGSKVEF